MTQILNLLKKMIIGTNDKSTINYEPNRQTSACRYIRQVNTTQRIKIFNMINILLTTIGLHAFSYIHGKKLDNGSQAYDRIF